MIRLSIVESVTDRRPNTYGPIGWSEFVQLMREQSEIAAEPIRLGKASTLCVSPAIYEDAAYRSKGAVRGWNWFSADIDNKCGNRPGATIDEVAAAMTELDAPFLIYTTASHAPAAQCFRLMFPLDRMITASEFDGVWRSFASKFGCFDEQTKDVCRLFIAPRAWSGRANQFISHTEGTPVCVNRIVESYPVEAFAPISAASIAVARAVQVELRHVAHLTDLYASPVVSRSAIEIAMSSAPGGRMYRFLCSVACSARRQGVALDGYDLRQIGEQMAMLLGCSNRNDIGHDVRSALRFADQASLNQRAVQLDRLQAALVGRTPTRT